MLHLIRTHDVPIRSWSLFISKKISRLDFFVRVNRHAEFDHGFMSDAHDAAGDLARGKREVHIRSEVDASRIVWCIAYGLTRDGGACLVMNETNLPSPTRMTKQGPNPQRVTAFLFCKRQGHPDRPRRRSNESSPMWFRRARQHDRGQSGHLRRRAYRIHPPFAWPHAEAGTRPS